jgi:hypothetical protein
VISAIPRLDFGSRRRGFGIVLLALAGSFLVVTYFVVVSGLSPARTYLYGGPIAIGLCHNDFVFLTANTCASGTDAWARYVIDIALVAILLIGIGGVAGPGALVFATAGALLGVRLSLHDARGAVHIVPSWLIIVAIAIAASYIGPRAVAYLRGLGPRPVAR